MLTALISAALAAMAASTAQSVPERPQITVFEHPGYQGRSMVIDGDAPDLRWVAFNDMISSMRIEGGQWEVCLEPVFAGPARWSTRACLT